MHHIPLDSCGHLYSDRAKLMLDISSHHLVKQCEIGAPSSFHVFPIPVVFIEAISGGISWEVSIKPLRYLGCQLHETTNSQKVFNRSISIYIYIHGTPPPRPILFDNLLLFAVFCCFFSMFKCVFFFWRLFYIFKKLCRVVKTLPLIKLFSFNRMIFTKP